MNARADVAGVRRAIARAGLTVLTAGCFAYRPSDPSGVRVGEIVRVDITPAGAEQMTRQVGPRVESLGGRVLQPRDSTLVLAITELIRSRSTAELWTGDSVSVPVSGMGAMSVRRFDGSRTVLAVAGAAVAIVVMRRVIDEAGVFAGRPTPQPGTQ